jgi:hypothetical protein
MGGTIQRGQMDIPDELSKRLSTVTSVEVKMQNDQRIWDNRKNRYEEVESEIMITYIKKRHSGLPKFFYYDTVYV